MIRVIVCDDQEIVVQGLSTILNNDPQIQVVATASNGLEVMEQVATHHPDLVLMDLKMPEMDGLEVLTRLFEISGDAQVIMISGHGNIDTAVTAIKQGAYDFIEKPLDLNRLLITIRNAEDKTTLLNETKTLKKRVGKNYKMIGESPAIVHIREMIERVAPTDARILITGENGTGKEIVARMLHEQSERTSEPFVEVNCAAIPSELIESELFGHEKGAFTSAIKQRKGKFEQADGGTLFLDEIGDMSLSAQSKVLRALQENKITRVGSDKDIHVDVRIIAATNKDLFEMVEKGTFREDLYYRLNVLPLFIPNLKDRKEDILPLFYSIAHKMNTNIQLTTEVAEILTEYSWRGNVRELRNVVEFLASRGKNLIEVNDLPPLQRKRNTVGKTEYHHSSTIIDKFVLNEGREIELYGDVLKTLADSFEKKERYGRKKLLEIIIENGGYYTEGEIRKALSKLSGYGFVRSAKGRGGSVVTQEGLKLLEIIESYYEKGILG